jgi:hypothetical protein
MPLISNTCEVFWGDQKQTTLHASSIRNTKYRCTQNVMISSALIYLHFPKEAPCPIQLFNTLPPLKQRCINTITARSYETYLNENINSTLRILQTIKTLQEKDGKFLTLPRSCSTFDSIPVMFSFILETILKLEIKLGFPVYFYPFLKKIK